tara:strand:+ start:6666 stop:6815 length:150 start_codon:yes stop_codon:yes gene_type:complete
MSRSYAKAPEVEANRKIVREASFAMKLNARAPPAACIGRNSVSIPNPFG